jgi:2-polyprenyl-3-methyl-5-hydroxy-6-metoxy-1,4-benzoquinol methylase
MSSRREFFNTAAVTWDERFQNQELIDFLTKLVPTFQLKQGQRVLDVGTGTGILIPFLLEAVGSTGHVTTIDFAEKMVEACKAKYASLPNVNIAVQQVENLEFPSETFDAVTCFGLFPHLENKQKALSQMNRVLKPDGKLIIAHALSSKELIAHHRNETVVAHDALPDEAEMKRLLRQAGFTEVQITDKPGSYVCLSTKPQLNDRKN